MLEKIVKGSTFSNFNLTKVSIGDRINNNYDSNNNIILIHQGKTTNNIVNNRDDDIFELKPRTPEEQEAYAGDIIGVFDPGLYSIGDTFTSAKKPFITARICTPSICLPLSMPYMKVV